jgi:hypothetical protein
MNEIFPLFFLLNIGDSIHQLKDNDLLKKKMQILEEDVVQEIVARFLLTYPKTF